MSDTSGTPHPLAGPPGGGRWSLRVPARVMASPTFRRVAPKIFPPFHRFVVRVTGGRTMLDSKAQPMLLLVTRGAKTGRRREAPLAAVPSSDGRLLVVGSNFARASHPAWTANLMADPAAEVVFRGERFAVDARLLPDEERAARWPELVSWYPGWVHYAEDAAREFRVFELARREAK